MDFDLLISDLTIILKDLYWIDSLPYLWNAVCLFDISAFRRDITHDLSVLESLHFSGGNVFQ